MALTTAEIKDMTMIAMDQPPAWPEDTSTYKFTIKTTTRNFTYSFRFNSGRVILKWGDGAEEEIEASSLVDHTHKYSVAGKYQISISGEIGRVRYPGTQNQKNALISIDTPFRDRISNGRDNLDQIFMNCRNLVSIPKGLFNCYKRPNIYFTSIESTFENCYSLLSIPEKLFDGLNFSFYNRDFTERIFYGCHELVHIPDDIFSNPTIANFDSLLNGASMFRECYKLTNIPKSFFTVFKNSFAECFYSCRALQHLPTDDGFRPTFRNVTTVYGCDYCFYDCQSLLEVPESIFSECSLITRLYYAFYNCYSLISIPSGLFPNCPSVTSFYYCFSHCESLQTIPSGLFKNCPSVTNFSYCFSHCESLQTIPNDIFQYSDYIDTVTGCFSYCSSLTSLSEYIFKNKSALRGLSECFSYCTSLLSISSNLFDDLVNARNFNSCFYHCESLLALPNDLFKYTVSGENFGSCFAHCYSITSVPDEFYINCINAINVESFYNCINLETVGDRCCYNLQNVINLPSFTGCVNLRYIGESAFENCVSASEGLYMGNAGRDGPGLVIGENVFKNCSSLPAIHMPTGLTSIAANALHGCTGITSMSRSFSANTPHIAIIPRGLFRDLINVTDFSYCFEGNQYIQSVPGDLFDNCVSANNFRSCFASCTGITSSVPEIWYLFPNAEHYACFAHCTNAQNYEDIPYDWKRT